MRARAIGISVLALAATIAALVILARPREETSSSSTPSTRVANADARVVLDAPGDFATTPETTAERREELTPRVATAAPGTLTLVVRVRTPDGRACEHGRIECHHAPRLSGPGVAGRVVAEVVAEETRIVLPIASDEAELLVSGTGHADARVVLDRLRWTTGWWSSATDVVERAVEVQLTDEVGETGVLEGTITLDGARRVPESLSIRVKPIRRRNEKSDRRPSVHASLDEEHARYRCAGLAPGAYDVMAESTTSVARGAVVRVAAEAPSRLDLDLTSGATLRVTAFSAETRGPAAGRELLVSYLPVVEAMPGLDRSGEQYKVGVTDAAGECEFVGVPTGTELVVTEDPEGKRLEFLQLEAGTRAATAEVWLDGDDPRDGSVWGTLDARQRGERRALHLVARSLDGGRKTTQSMPVGADRWSMRARNGARYALWLEKDWLPITEVVEVRFTASEQGPIVLPPLARSRRTVRWSNAPIGWTLLVGERGGLQPSAAATPFELDRSDGTAELDLLGGATIDATLRSPQGSTATWTWADPPPEGELAIDLRVDAMTRVTCSISAERPKGSARLTLSALAPPAGFAASGAWMDLDDGESVSALPLPRGTYFFRLHRPCFEAVVCGTFRADGGGTSDIAWSGTAVRLQDLGWTLKNRLELASVRGVALDAVPLVSRRFVLAELCCPSRAPEIPLETVLLDVESCTFVVRDP